MNLGDYEPHYGLPIMSISFEKRDTLMRNSHMIQIYTFAAELQKNNED